MCKGGENICLLKGGWMWSGRGHIHLEFPLLWSSRFDFKHLGLSGPASRRCPRVEPTATWGGACPGVVTTGDGWVHKQPGKWKKERQKGRRDGGIWEGTGSFSSFCLQIAEGSLLPLYQGRQVTQDLFSFLWSIPIKGLEIHFRIYTYTHKGNILICPEGVMRIRWNVHASDLELKMGFLNVSWCYLKVSI